MRGTFILKDNQKELYNNGTYKAVMKEKNKLYREGKLWDESKATKYGNVIDTQAFTCANEEDVAECLKMRNNRRSRARKIRNRIVYWANLRNRSTKIDFLTFTFTDEVLKTTSKDTRVQYIRRTLGPLCEDYIGNVDYSPETGREHYHFLAITTPLVNLVKELEQLRDKLGRIHVEHVRNTADSLDKLSSYTDKMANHAVKTENNCNIIAKRNTDYHRFEELSKYLGPRKEWIHCFPEDEERAREYANLTDYPAWIKHNNLYGGLNFEYFYKYSNPMDDITETQKQIEELYEQYGENYELDYGYKVVDGFGRIIEERIMEE